MIWLLPSHVSCACKYLKEITKKKSFHNFRPKHKGKKTLNEMYVTHQLRIKNREIKAKETIVKIGSPK
jgi:hypothetical protein